MKNLKHTAIAAGVIAAFSGGMADASHFRGAAMIPSVDSDGKLTVTTTSFWRPTSVSSVASNVGGASLVSRASSVVDTSDVRFTKVTNIDTFQLSGGGTFSITGNSCCRVDGIANWPGSNSSTSWTMNSTIVWNGTSANTPILFNFSAVQPEVVRGSDYSGNLGAVAGPGLTLSYDQILNGIPTQPPGFTIDPVTGQLFISSANTATYPDNADGNIGADYAFSGHISASDGSSVEFDWLFDAVNTGSGNLAPVVSDMVINALVGDTINFQFTATDDGNPNPPGGLTWSFVGFLGGGINAPTFNSATQQFVWNSAGSAVGTYVAQVQASDGSLTDIGLLTINLGMDNGPGGQIPIPGTLSLVGLGLMGLGVAGRRKRVK
ncbi:hypothetical protein [Nitrosospira sp. Is2]|uniref:hypothetical protein n=1 Tax=Nitrosospira sp. Is2 TaxID=3080532 RepID=UPI0029553DE6|nr:hypothetical protein [Nitrosospira sp. Is2]WON72518.1 hypothetical protein R5L00_08330 [Nitrosospira sp. Is2]